MDFSYTAEEIEFRDELRVWLDENLPVGWVEGERELPKDDAEKADFLRAWQRKLYDGGWTGLNWPKEYGGRGVTLMEEVIVQEEMTRVKAPPVINFMGINMVGPTLIQIGTDEQKERYVDKILSGEEIWCQGFSEPNAGSDVAAITTSAVKDGDKWRINGQKVWTTYALAADRCFVLVRTDSTGKKHHGLTAFLIDMKDPGVEVKPINQMDDNHDFNEIFLSDVVAYDKDIVGEVNEGWKVAMTLLTHERVGIAGTIFHLQGTIEEVIDMAKRSNINEESLMDNDTFRRNLVNYQIRAKGSLLNYYRNVTKTIRQGYPGPEGSIDKLASSLLSKELMGFVTSSRGPVSVLRGDSSLTNGLRWTDRYLSSFGGTIAGGTSEISKNVIGERILKLPRDIKH